MFEYPDIECYFRNCNIKIDDIFENDEIHILSQNGEVKHILLLTSEIINSIKNNVYYFSDYKIKFSNGVLNIEYIFPDVMDFDYCFLNRKSNSNIINFDKVQNRYFAYRLLLSDFELKPKDKLIYKVDFTNFELFLTESIIESIKSEFGYLSDLKHVIKYYIDEELGIKYILIKTNTSFNITNSHYLQYYDMLTNKIYTQYDIIEYDEYYLMANGIKFQTGTLNIKYENGTQFEIILDDIIARIDEFNHHSIIKYHFYEISIVNNSCFMNGFTNTFNIIIYNLSNLLFDEQNCLIKSDNIFNVYKYQDVNIRKITMTSNPNYDTEDQLQVYTKAELDHIKHRCICNLSQIINQLNNIRFGESEDSDQVKQAKADYIFNYKVMPSSYSTALKKRIYNMFGPFSDFKFDDL